MSDQITDQEYCVLAASFIHATRYFTMLDDDHELIPYSTCCCPALHEAAKALIGYQNGMGTLLCARLARVFQPDGAPEFWWGFPARQADGRSSGTVEQQEARILALLLLGELMADGSIDEIPERAVA